MPSDILEFQPKIKHMNFIDHSEGMSLFMMAERKVSNVTCVFVYVVCVVYACMLEKYHMNFIDHSEGMSLFMMAKHKVSNVLFWVRACAFMSCLNV